MHPRIRHALPRRDIRTNHPASAIPSRLRVNDTIFPRMAQGGKSQKIGCRRPFCLPPCPLGAIFSHTRAAQRSIRCHFSHLHPVNPVSWLFNAAHRRPLLPRPMRQTPQQPPRTASSVSFSFQRLSQVGCFVLRLGGTPRPTKRDASPHQAESAIHDVPLVDIVPHSPARHKRDFGHRLLMVFQSATRQMA